MIEIIIAIVLGILKGIAWYVLIKLISAREAAKQSKEILSIVKFTNRTQLEELNLKVANEIERLKLANKLNERINKGD